MLSKYRYYILIFACLLLSLPILCRPIDKRSTYPFTVSISVSGNSVYLSDYAETFYPPVSITVVCNDPSIANLQVKLSVGIKVGGFSAESKTYNTLPPISLGAGDVYMLSGEEVSKLYSKENLQYSGLLSDRMPEGLAEFTVKVLEYNTGVQLSNTAYTLKNLKELAPARLFSPINKSEFKIEQASNILFTWSSVFVPNTSSVEYEFILKEVQDESTNISSAFNYSPIIYKETTNLTSLIYSIDKPLLEEGKTYAWAVKTIVRDAKGVVQDIVNNGFSEVYSFKVPRPVVQTPQSNKVPEKDDEDDSHCGEIPEINISNQTPIESLKVGDTITAGDFPILLLEVSGGNGNFSGKGSVEIPYISKLVRFAVEFENIGVNTDKQLISGEIKGVRSGNLDNIANLDAIDYGSTREVEKAIISSDISLKVSLPKDPIPTIEYNFESKLLTFYDATGAVIVSTELNNPVGEKVFPIIVEDENGELYQISETKSDSGESEVTISHIGKKGRKIPSDAFSGDFIDEHIAVVEFEALDSPYSFDTYMEYYKNIPLINQINTLEPDLRYPELAKDYHTPWQFIPIGEIVNLKAKLKIKDKKADFEPKDIIFATEKGIIMPSTFNEKDNTYTLSAPAAAEEGYYFIHALYERGDNDYLHFGKVGIDTRKPISAKVVLVPMGGTYNKNAIASGINEISKQVGLSWQVEEYTDFEYSSELSASLFEKNSGVLFSYNDAQSVLNSALKAHLGSKFDPSACYVFMLDKAPFKNDRNIIGFMPRGGKFGYIHCQGLNSESLAQILAHELMHGQFLLRHTFDDKYAPNLKQGVNPTNLMDYKGGTHIAKWQWDQIYDPAITTSLIKYDEDGEFWISVVKIGAKAAVNILVQMSIIYLTNDDVEEFEQALHYVDFTEVAINAAIPAASILKKFKIFNKIKSPDELEALVDIAGNLYLCIKDKQINSATDFIKELNICGAQAIFDYVLGTVADVSIDKAVQKIRRIIPNFSYKKSHIGEQQDANAPPQISANTENKALPEAKQQLLLPEKIRFLRHKLADYPNLNKKLSTLNELKEKFIDDFDELTDEDILFLENNTNCVDAWKRLHDCQAPDDLRQNFGAVKALATDIKTDVRPDPSTYLSKEYIDAHMKKFEDGAACIMRRDHFENFKDFPDLENKFITTKQDIETLIRDSNKNIEYLKEKLGITDKKYPKDPKNIYVIYFTPQQLKNASIPSGNEGGANELWIPGGYTASENAFGHPELVITIPKTEVKTIQLSKYYENR